MRCIAPRAEYLRTMADRVNEMDEALRPSRPLTLRLTIRLHYILLIIHVNANSRPEFSVMYSKPYYLEGQIQPGARHDVQSSERHKVV